MKHVGNPERFSLVNRPSHGLPLDSVPSVFWTRAHRTISLSLYLSLSLSLQGKTLTTLLQAHVDVIVAGMQRAAGAK